MGDPRVLLGKGTSARGSSKYSLWVSKSGQDVLTDGDDDLMFNGGIGDLNPTGSTVENKHGEVPSVLFKGYSDVSVTVSGASQSATATLKVWADTSFRDSGNTARAPFAIAQVGVQSGSSATSHYANNTYFASSYTDTARGLYLNVYATGRDSNGNASGSGTYGALIANLQFRATGTYRVYYAVMNPFISS